MGHFQHKLLVSKAIAVSPHKSTEQVLTAKELVADITEAHFAHGNCETDTTKNETMLTVEAPPAGRDFEEEEKQPIRTPKKSVRKAAQKHAQPEDDETFNAKRTMTARRK